jgi:hypothetical protein
MKFKPGDIVVVSGVTETSGDSSVNNALCEVVECGKYDVFLKKLSSVFPTIFPYSLSRCQKINLNAENLRLSVVEPKVGDLVLSMYSGLNKIEKCVGVVEKIIDKPGSKKSLSLRTSSKTTVVAFDTVIILED